jgi:flagellar biosynthesis GTPase FlhF
VAKATETTDLEDLDVLEVSLVKRGANKKRFALWKNEGETVRDLTAAILAAPGDNDPELSKEMVTKGISKEARATIQDAVKLLSAVKEEMTGGLYKQIQSALGLKGLEEDKPEEKQEEAAPPDQVPEEEKAEEAPPPPPPPTEEEKAEEETEEEKAAKAEAALSKLSEGAPLQKSGNPQIVALFKQVADLERINKAHESEKREKEFVAKAQADFSTVPGATPEEVGIMLRDLDDLNPAIAQRVEVVLKASNAFVKNSGLIGEVGSSQSGQGNPFVKGSDFDNQIEGLAKQRVAKTGEVYAVAYEKVLGENADLYSKSIGWKD